MKWAHSYAFVSAPGSYEMGCHKYYYYYYYYYQVTKRSRCCVLLDRLIEGGCWGCFLEEGREVCEERFFKWVLWSLLFDPDCFDRCCLWSGCQWSLYHRVMPVLVVAACEVGGFGHYTARSRLFLSLLLVKWVPLHGHACFDHCLLWSGWLSSLYCTVPPVLIIASSEVGASGHFCMVLFFVFVFVKWVVLVIILYAPARFDPCYLSGMWLWSCSYGLAHFEHCFLSTTSTFSTGYDRMACKASPGLSSIFLHALQPSVVHDGTYIRPHTSILLYRYSFKHSTCIRPNVSTVGLGCM